MRLKKKLQLLFFLFFFPHKVVLHRLSWQKVWTIPAPADNVTVGTLAWRPDGRGWCITFINLAKFRFGCLSPSVKSFFSFGLFMLADVF